MRNIMAALALGAVVALAVPAAFASSGAAAQNDSDSVSQNAGNDPAGDPDPGFVQYFGPFHQLRLQNMGQ